MKRQRAFAGARIFDGAALCTDHALLVQENGKTQAVPITAIPQTSDIYQLDGGIITPGFVDLQVNGGGGVMFNTAPDLETLATIAAAHRGLGTAAFLPTLITDTRDHSVAAIKTVAQAIDQRVPGVIGLHLEGPHLSVRRKGAHDGNLIRPMEDDDVSLLLDTLQDIPNLFVTAAPENISFAQIETLSKAGVLVSIGHSDCDYDTAMRAFDAGARMATHLFNAMSQASARSPGLVGAALDHPDIAPGLIADGIHVHAAMIRAALAANRGKHDIFLVTDAMAPAGSDITSFTLNDREILRRGGRLTLADGTLAGADLTMPQAIRFMVDHVGEPLETALARATTIPAGLLQDVPDLTHVDAMIWLDDDLGTPRWLNEL